MNFKTWLQISDLELATFQLLSTSSCSAPATPGSFRIPEDAKWPSNYLYMFSVLVLYHTDYPAPLLSSQTTWLTPPLTILLKCSSPFNHSTQSTSQKYHLLSVFSHGTTDCILTVFPCYYILAAAHTGIQ